MLLGTQAFRRDIRSLRPIENVGREQRSLHFLGSPRALKFVGLGGGSQVQNGLRVIEYRVVPANGGFQLVRKFGRFDASGSLTNPSLKHPVVVLDHLLEAKFFRFEIQ